MYKAAKEGPQKIVTANRLIDGKVIFLGPDRKWVENLADAEPMEDGALVEAAMAFGQAEIVARKVTELYPVDVVMENGVPMPVRLRERIRALGPTVDYGAAEVTRLRAGHAGE
jgi:hypothetical protein